MRQEVEFRRGIEYAAPHYITPVLAQGSARENGVRLLDVYAALRGAEPDGLPLSATNRACVLLLPGVYDLPSGSLVLDTEFVDIVGVGAPEQVILTSDGTTVAKTANNVLISGVTLRTTAVTVGTPDGNTPAAFYPSSGYAEEVLRDVILEQTTTTGVLTRRGISYAGTYAVTLKAPSGSNIYAFDGAISGRFDVFAEFQNLALGYFVGGSDHSCTHRYGSIVLRSLNTTGTPTIYLFGHSWAGFGDRLDVRITNTVPRPAGTINCVVRTSGEGDSVVSTATNSQRTLPYVSLEANEVNAFGVILSNNVVGANNADCNQFRVDTLLVRYSQTARVCAVNATVTGANPQADFKTQSFIRYLRLERAQNLSGGVLALCCCAVAANSSGFFETGSIVENVEFIGNVTFTSSIYLFAGAPSTSSIRFNGYVGRLFTSEANFGPQANVLGQFGGTTTSPAQGTLFGWFVWAPLSRPCAMRLEECTVVGTATVPPIADVRTPFPVQNLCLYRCTLISSGTAACIATGLSPQDIRSYFNAYNLVAPFGAGVNNLIGTPFDVTDTDVIAR